MKRNKMPKTAPVPEKMDVQKTQAKWNSILANAGLPAILPKIKKRRLFLNKKGER